ncbi:MAG: response regulator [Erysipelotrichaceae bacterium]|nr:response regulator [Erysipelotrichaceae bacterium]
MQENNKTNNYLVPIALAATLVVLLVFGIFYMRNSLLKMTAEERSNQLEEMVIQINTNLTNGLQTHWNLVEGIDQAMSGKHYADKNEVCANIALMEDFFCTDLYGSHVMLLDNQGIGYLSSGSVGIWNDVNHLIDGNEKHTFVSETDNINGSHLIFSKELSEPITIDDNNSFNHVVLLKDIKTVKQYYTTTTYEGKASTYFIRNNGILAYYDSEVEDVIASRNIFKALAEVEYIQNESFSDIKEELAEDGIATADIRISGSEYFYCLASLQGYDMYLMLLVPAKSVAVSTMNMMNSTVRTETVFGSILMLMTFLVFYGFVKVQRSSQLVKLEQETNKELNRLRNIAESANAAKSTFLNNMSHDIRTPMNAIIGFTNIALKNNPSPEIKNCLEKISDSSDHLLALINDVLDISRIESGKIHFAPVVVELSEITAAVLSIMDGYLSNRELRFEYNIEKPIVPFVMTDAVRIREVLVNILGNAVKFTPDGGTIHFDTKYQIKDANTIVVHYFISDTGIGMSEEFLSHIFDEFSQEDHGARTQYKGTGLGMTISKQYIDMMNGTISVASKKNEGSSFLVEIPMTIADGTAIAKQENNSAYCDLNGTGILLVEDNDLNAEIAIVQLEEYGFDITRASDGKEAVEIFNSKPEGSFDIILMDVMMPKMNGYEATKAIRNLQNRPDAAQIPIIAMTANAFAEDVQASLDAGMNGHLSKPIVINEVIKAIERNIH